MDMERLLIDISLSSFQTNPQFCTAMGSFLYNGPIDALLRYYQSLNYEFICFIPHSWKKNVSNWNSGTRTKKTLQRLCFSSSLRGNVPTARFGIGPRSHQQWAESALWEQCVTFGAFEQKGWLQLSAQLSFQTLSEAHCWKGHGLGLQLVKKLSTKLIIFLEMMGKTNRTRKNEIWESDLLFNFCLGILRCIEH